MAALSRRTFRQDNLQQFAIQQLALKVSLQPEQLTFRAFIEGDRESELFDAKGEPDAHKATRLFDPGAPLKYRFVQTSTRPIVRFCWTVDRNAAGRFLIFRERVFKTCAARDRFEPIREKIAAIRACRGNLQELETKRADRANRKGAVR